MNIQVQSKGGDSIKLKDKKIGILGKTYTRDKYGNSKVSYAPIAPPLWAYFLAVIHERIIRHSEAS